MKKTMVLFKDGSASMHVVQVVGGACSAGDPTAFVVKNGSVVWVVPGQSVSWVEFSAL